jgi:hypothetical protein
MILTKVKDICDCCDQRKESKQVKINLNGPHIDSNLMYMCVKCELRFADRDYWGGWLNAVKYINETVSKNIP